MAEIKGRYRATPDTLQDKQWGDIRVSATGALVVEEASDSTLYSILSAGIVTCSTDITRPSDTTAYAANDALSDSTSAPTSGGFTFTGAARASGKSGIITDVVIASSNSAGGLSAELFIFDTSVTNINDNSAFAVSDAEIKTLVAKIPFTLAAGGNNSHYHAQNLNIGFTTVGSANLRFLIKVTGAYTPISAEVFTVRAKIAQVN